MNAIQKIDETLTINHRSQPIAPHETAALAAVLAVLKKYFLAWDEWNFFVRQGSLTLQRKTDSRSVIKLFVDGDGRLTSKVPFPDAPPPVGVKKDAVIIGITLGHLDPYERDAMRDRLASDFGWQYRDPRQCAGGTHKFTLLPQVDYRYDGIVLPKGDCPARLAITDVEYEECFGLIATVTVAQEAFQSDAEMSVA